MRILNKKKFVFVLVQWDESGKRVYRNYEKIYACNKKNVYRELKYTAFAVPFYEFIHYFIVMACSKIENTHRDKKESRMKRKISNFGMLATMAQMRKLKKGILNVSGIFSSRLHPSNVAVYNFFHFPLFSFSSLLIAK